MSMVFIGGAVTAGGDPLAGTWHERDGGTSNIFWFIGEPVEGVYPVLFYDDFTSPVVCGDNGAMMWAGFAQETEPNTIQGTMGEYWCPGTDLRGPLQYPNPGIVDDVVPFTIDYFADTNTMTSYDFVGTGQCVGTPQPHIKTVAKAIQELGKGMFPESGVGVDIGCGG
jgi:hypothetical protein